MEVLHENTPRGRDGKGRTERPIFTIQIRSEDVKGHTRPLLL